LGFAASTAIAQFAPGGAPGRAHASALPRTVDLRATLDRTLADALGGGVPADMSVYARPKYALESSDVFYPPWLEGTWDVTSKSTAVLAPVGTLLFGPPGAYDRAKASVAEPPLRYLARFVPAGDGIDACICSRPFTVASISRAAMGPNAVLSVGGANDAFDLLQPANSPDELEVRIQMGGRRYRALLQVISRTFRAPTKTSFECSELTRQTIFSEAAGDGSAMQPGPRPLPPPSVKEIETVSTYDLQPSGVVTSKQRTLTFLVADAAYTMPSSDPALDLQALGRARAAGRYAIDARTYDLTYTRIRAS
jgi:hypothetical protein